MDPISFAPLVVSAWTLIAPYAKKIAGKMADKAIEALPDVTGKVWDLIKAKMESKPETQSLPADLVKEPDDAVVQGAFQYQLKKLLENDEAFARQLDNLVKEAQSSAKTNIAYEGKVEGDGALAQGPGATAVGKGSLYIGHGDGSTIVTGDDNTIEDD